MADTPPYVSPSGYKAAVDWLVRRTGLKPKQLRAIGKSQQKEARIISRLANRSVFADVLGKVDAGEKDEVDFARWKKETAIALREQWAATLGNNRLHVIIQTAAQSAFQRGRNEELLDPAVKRALPWWQYTALLDMPETPPCKVCRALNAITLPANHPFWKTHTPPMHFNCRCSLIPMSKWEGPDYSSEGVRLPQLRHLIPPGFGKAPPKNPSKARPLPKVTPFRPGGGETGGGGSSDSY